MKNADPVFSVRSTVFRREEKPNIGGNPGKPQVETDPSNSETTKPVDSKTLNAKNNPDRGLSIRSTISKLEDM